MRVNSTGDVLVSAPYHTSRLLIDRFVNNNKDWIIKRKEASKRYEIKNGLKLGELTVVHDDTLSIDFQYDSSKKELKLSLVDKVIAKTIIKGFIDTKAKELLPALVKKVAEDSGQGVTSVRVKNTKSRWGSCSSKGNINISKYVWLLPQKLRHYVVAHEVAHLSHLNHSKDFWNFVATMHPDHKTSRAEIRDLSGLLGCLD